jgi:hypothetical protein
MNQIKLGALASFDRCRGGILEVRLRLVIERPEEVGRPRWEGRDLHLALSGPLIRANVVLTGEVASVLAGYLLAVLPEEEAPHGGDPPRPLTSRS